MKKLSENDEQGWLAQPLLIILITYGICFKPQMLFNLSRDMPLFYILESSSKLQNQTAEKMIPPIIYEPGRVWRLALLSRNEFDEALKESNEVLFI